MKARVRRGVLVAFAIYAAVFVSTSALGGLAYFHFASPQRSCAGCHEMTGVHSGWSASAHRTVACRQCHGGALTLDGHALRSHVERVAQHLSGKPAPEIRLKPEHVMTVHASCRACHPQAFADWQSSGHAATLGRILLDPKQNVAEPPTDDCLRCHGQFVGGGMAALVRRVSDTGVWALNEPSRAGEPAIPCLSCHQVHASTESGRVASSFLRRERRHVSADLLPVVPVHRGLEDVKVSRDPRQRVCVQCHAPAASHQLATSDDHTPAGVHEGLSCRDCHWSHANSAKASCRACHPADSHCGLEVEKMDTTFLNRDSRHDVHTVACTDCHVDGAPRKTRPVKF